MKQGISVVIPCFKSENSIESVVTSLLALPIFRSKKAEVICVCDGSPDDVCKVVKKLAKDSRVKLIQLTKNFGQHNALIAGIRAANYSICITMDDDGQHLANQIIKLTTELESKNLDVVYGSPSINQHSTFRTFSSQLIKKIVAPRTIAV